MRFLPRLMGLALLVHVACAAKPVRPNIVLVTLDTTRADRMGFLGSRRGLTPNLDALAKEGVVFSRAYAQSPLTPPSHATILTGTYPQFHHVNEFGIPLAKELPYLPQILHERGYKTAAFVGSMVLDPKAHMAPGFERGFDTYDAGFHARQPGEARYQAVERRGGDVVARALSWLEEQGRGPFFLWVHLFDPHAPYEPPEPFKSRHASDPYDGEIAYADSALGKALDQLRASGLYAGALIAVTADHGEAFGEHGERSHGVFLYDETIHVPLIFKMPEQRFAGRRVDDRAGLVDVAPTILEVLEIPAPKASQGESLMALMRPTEGGRAVAAKAVSERPAYAETDYAHLNFGWSSLRALRTDKYLFIGAPRKELYDQSKDPPAEHDLSSAASSVTQTLSGRLDAFRRRTARAAQPATPAANPELSERLAALGYLSSGSMVSAAGAGADPKDKIELANQVQDALLAQEDGRQEDAIRILEKVLAKDPSIGGAHQILGSLLMDRNEIGRAVPVLRRAVELRHFSTDHYALGLALFRAGELQSAKTELEAAIAKPSPAGPYGRAKQHYALAGVYNGLGRTADSTRELQAAVRLDPDNYESNLNLGRLLSMQGNAAAGLPYLQKAASLQPKTPDPHFFLAHAYGQLGQQADATRERLEAERLRASGQPR